jgi:hypothetical protein
MSTTSPLLLTITVYLFVNAFFNPPQPDTVERYEPHVTNNVEITSLGDATTHLSIQQDIVPDSTTADTSQDRSLAEVYANFCAHVAFAHEKRAMEKHYRIQKQYYNEYSISWHDQRLLNIKRAEMSKEDLRNKRLSKRRPFMHLDKGSLALKSAVEEEKKRQARLEDRRPFLFLDQRDLKVRR